MARGISSSPLSPSVDLFGFAPKINLPHFHSPHPNQLLMMQRSSILCTLTSDEIHVAQVLLDITSLIRTGSDLKWGSKKRRSRLKNDVLLEVAASSPVTPLSFCPAESDDHHLPDKRMSRREYMEMIEELSQRRDLLRGEIEEVIIYYNKLVAQNSQLKAMKQELQLQLLNYSCPGKQTSIVGTKLIPVENETHGFGPIPDLNMDPNEAFDRRARFAEARRKRKDIIRLKSFKFPTTR